jgi:hypothetical protein
VSCGGGLENAEESESTKFWLGIARVRSVDKKDRDVLVFVLALAISFIFLNSKFHIRVRVLDFRYKR